MHPAGALPESGALWLQSGKLLQLARIDPKLAAERRRKMAGVGMAKLAGNLHDACIACRQQAARLVHALAQEHAVHALPVLLGKRSARSIAPSTCGPTLLDKRHDLYGYWFTPAVSAGMPARGRSGGIGMSWVF